MGLPKKSLPFEGQTHYHHREGKTLSDLESKLRRTDFSKYTDLKGRLANTLFGEKKMEKKRNIAFFRLSEEESELVTAAQGISDPGYPPKKDH